MPNSTPAPVFYPGCDFEKIRAAELRVLPRDAFSSADLRLGAHFTLDDEPGDFWVREFDAITVTLGRPSGPLPCSMEGCRGHEAWDSDTFEGLVHEFEPIVLSIFDSLTPVDPSISSYVRQEAELFPSLRAGLATVIVGVVIEREMVYSELPALADEFEQVAARLRALAGEAS